MGVGHPVMLEREQELAALSAAADDAVAGHGALVLVEGPAGIGKTTLLRAAFGRCDGPRVLTARGLSLEQGFPYGVVRQLLDPVRADGGLLDGAAALAARVFDWTEAGPVEDDVPYATMHGLYWLVANLAARQPLVLAVDDAHWADAPSLRWLAHLAARLDELPAAVFLAVRDGPDSAALLDELRASPGVTRLGLGPLGPGATAELIRRRLGRRADEDMCRDCHASTGGNPFLLEALATALRDHPRTALEPVAAAVLRRVAQLGDGAAPLTRALAVLGGPAPLRHPAALAGPDALTSAERRVAVLAADGLSNRQIAEHLFVTQATVETHLRHAFRKLGVTSRGDLPRALDR